MREQEGNCELRLKQKQTKLCFAFATTTAKGQAAKAQSKHKEVGTVRSSRRSRQEEVKTERERTTTNRTVRKIPFINGKGIWNLVRKATKCCREREGDRKR